MDAGCIEQAIVAADKAQGLGTPRYMAQCPRSCAKRPNFRSDFLGEHLRKYNLAVVGTKRLPE
jgi:hypothetical protein